MEKVEILEKTVVELNNKVEIKKLYETEKVVHSLTRMVLSLETELKKIKDANEN